MKGLLKGESALQDREIVKLYWDRDERAIEATDETYGAYCRAVSVRIVHSREDAEECVNDAYLHLWNTIPPQCPAFLRTFLGRIVRNLSLDRARLLHAQKRGGGELPLALEELAECVPDLRDVEQTVENEELRKALNAFLSTLPQRDAVLFTLRYFYLYSVQECAERCGMRENAARTSLHRIRKKLRQTLEQEDFSI